MPKKYTPTAATHWVRRGQTAWVAVCLLVVVQGVARPVPPDSLLRPLSGHSFKRLALKHPGITDTFKTARWDAHAIDIYRQDLTVFEGNFTCLLEDTARGLAFVFPIRQHQRVSSPFGPRIMYGSNFHFGTDLKLYTGDTVVAALPGVVRVARYDPGYGHFVVVAHPNGLETLYGHLSKRLVTPGTRVAAGQVLGLGGSTGRSTGPHLHFEFRFLGEQFDPEKIVSFTSQQVLHERFDIYASYYDHLVELREAKYHRIRGGDTLGAIARRYGTSISRICQLNGISTRTVLRIGRTLRIN